MQLKDVMHKGFESIDVGANIQRAAAVMKSLDVGMLPVMEDGRLVGTITDRDITVRATARGASPDQTPVSDVMSRGVVFGYEDDDLRKAAGTMEEAQVRRLLVLDRADKCVGILSLGDLALETDEPLSGEVVREVSRPGH
jgi:CBS domain-containing protein